MYFFRSQDSLNFVSASIEKLVETLQGKVLNEDCSGCQDVANGVAGDADQRWDRASAATSSSSRNPPRCSECKDKQPRHVIFKNLAEFVQAEYGSLDHLQLLTAKQVCRSVILPEIWCLPVCLSVCPSVC